MPKSGLWCAPCLRSKQPAICRHKVEVVMSCLKLLPLTMAEMPREHQETLPNLKSKCPRKICFTECKRSAKFSFHTPDGVPICSFLIGHYHTAKRPCNRENHADTTESTTSSARPRRSWRVPHEHAKNPTITNIVLAEQHVRQFTQTSGEWQKETTITRAPAQWQAPRAGCGPRTICSRHGRI